MTKKVNKIRIYQEMSRRMLNTLLGSSHGGKRDLYDALGYIKEPTFDDYYLQYRRNGIAKAVINRPIQATWRGKIVIKSETNPTLEKAYADLDWQLRLKSKFIRADKLSTIGRYGVLLLGFNDTDASGYKEEVKKSASLKLEYVSPYSEKTAKINTKVTDRQDKRYGQPLLYEIMVEDSTNLLVHHSRIIHITGELLENNTEGIPYLEAVLNRLMDTDKIVGGDAEMYWRGARPGYNAEIKDDYVFDKAMEDDLEEQMEEYENDLRRVLIGEGYDLNALQQQIANPKDNIDIQIAIISATTGIPKRILLGSERGELSSSQDKDSWNDMIEERREEYADSHILGAFIDRCMQLGILPETKDWVSEWSPLYMRSDKDKTEVGLSRARTLKEYLHNPEAQRIIPPNQFLKLGVGLTEEQIAEIETEAEAYENDLLTFLKNEYNTEE